MIQKPLPPVFGLLQCDLPPADSEADVLADSEADVALILIRGTMLIQRRGGADSEADVLADSEGACALILTHLLMLTQRRSSDSRGAC